MILEVFGPPFWLHAGYGTGLGVATFGLCLLFMFESLLYIYFAIWCTFVIFITLGYPKVYIQKCFCGQMINVFRAIQLLLHV